MFGEIFHGLGYFTAYVSVHVRSKNLKPIRRLPGALALLSTIADFLKWVPEHFCSLDLNSKMETNFLQNILGFSQILLEFSQMFSQSNLGIFSQF